MEKEKWHRTAYHNVKVLGSLKEGQSKMSESGSQRGDVVLSIRPETWSGSIESVTWRRQEHQLPRSCVLQEREQMQWLKRQGMPFYYFSRPCFWATPGLRVYVFYTSTLHMNQWVCLGRTSIGQCWKQIQQDTFESFWSLVRWRADWPDCLRGGRGREGSLGDGYLSCLCVIKIFAWMACY